MNSNQTAVVKLIQAGKDPMVAVSEVYQITPQAAQKRLTRLLRHAQVYAALDASPVQTPQKPRKLMRGVYVSLPGPKAAQAYVEPKDALRSRLNALLFEGATLDHAGWVQLAADIREAGAGPHNSDFQVLSAALCDREVEDCRVHPERAYKHDDPRPHPEFVIPSDLKDRTDLEYEARLAHIEENRPYLPHAEPTPDGDAYRAYAAVCRKVQVTPEFWRQWAALGRPQSPMCKPLPSPAGAR